LSGKRFRIYTYNTKTVPKDKKMKNEHVQHYCLSCQEVIGRGCPDHTRVMRCKECVRARARTRKARVIARFVIQIYFKLFKGRNI